MMMKLKVVTDGNAGGGRLQQLLFVMVFYSKTWWMESEPSCEVYNVYLFNLLIRRCWTCEWGRSVNQDKR